MDSEPAGRRQGQRRESSRVEVEIPLNGLPVTGVHHLAATVHLPREPLLDPPVVLFCAPGGSATRRYYDLHVAGGSGYSFAAHFVDRGYVVVAHDHLGTGTSSRPADPAELVPEVVSDAATVLVSVISRQLAEGALTDALAPLPGAVRVGVAHSMGAMLAILQQDRARVFDALVLSGWGNVGYSDEVLRRIKDANFSAPDDYSPVSSRHLFDWMYSDDVPIEAIDAIREQRTNLPGATGPFCMDAANVAAEAARIDVPLFLAFGERDMAADPRAEPSTYLSSHDVTLFVLERSAHIHNVAGSRHLLWNRIERWCRDVAAALATEDGMQGVHS